MLSQKKIILQKSLVLIFLGFIFLQAEAQIRLPSVLQSNMVLQRESDVLLWGWSQPDESFKIKLSWQKDKIHVVADSLGKWRTTIHTGPAGEPVSIFFKGKKNKIILENILFGEVWLCSGQSNMVFTLNRLGGWDSEFYSQDKEDFLNNDYSDIRLFTVQLKAASEPEEDCTGTWENANLESVGDFSAVAFFYGRELYKKLKVPVGLINSNWGGTRAEAWTDQKVIETDSKLEYYRFDSSRTYRDQDKPGALYKGMVYPLLNYRIKGVIWYQGEANRNDASHYTDLFEAMIWNWRVSFKQELLPFYYVQIAPFGYKEAMVGALLREAQLDALEVPATGMAVTLDIGNFNNIHPKNKQEVGHRLSLIALHNTYGYSDLEYSGPVYTRGRVEDIPWIEDRKGIRMNFIHTTSGLVLKDSNMTGFTIAGKDQIFYSADAKAEGKSVVVWSEHVSKPYAVRYAFTNTPTATLFNTAGLPSSSFRTDRFRVFTSDAEIEIATVPYKNLTAFKLAISESGLQLHYTLDGSEPKVSSPLYYNPVVLRKTTRINVRAFFGKTPVEIQRSVEIIVHKALNKPVEYKYSYSSRYPGQGENSLVDGIRGDSLDYLTGWQGFEGEDVVVTIDLGKSKSVSSVSAGFLQNIDAWIFLPDSVTFSYSLDGKSFQVMDPVLHDIPLESEGSFSKEFARKNLKIRARYVKMNAKNIGICPSFHPGSGSKAWIFADEIVIK